ncbi:MAG: DUF5606 domain-containing protein [Dysgonamonadaceae bacterium]|jgi:hypothetical protein|nr:DUF5606 domain-containing protein [Dysgonamonadaceae bacterium]
MLKEIMSIVGKPGLFKKISQAKTIMIVESLLDGKRIPVYPRDKIISLGDISVYAKDGGDKLLYEIFVAIRTKENGKEVTCNIADTTQLTNYFAEIFPQFDREKVYLSDMKKMLTWYNLLISKGLSQFEPKSDEEETNNKVEQNESPVKTPKKPAKPAIPKEAKKKGVDKSRRIKQG